MLGRISPRSNWKKNGKLRNFTFINWVNFGCIFAFTRPVPKPSFRNSVSISVKALFQAVIGEKSAENILLRTTYPFRSLTTGTPWWSEEENIGCPIRFLQNCIEKIRRPNAIFTEIWISKKLLENIVSCLFGLKNFWN